MHFEFKFKCKNVHIGDDQLFSKEPFIKAIILTLTAGSKINQSMVAWLEDCFVVFPGYKNFVSGVKQHKSDK